MGLVLLVMRVKLQESGMFSRVHEQHVQRGNMLMLFSPKRLLLYISCIAIGTPVWYVIGVLVTFSPEFAKEGGSVDTIVVGQSVMWTYVGLAAGDLISGLLSQWFKSRRRAILLFLLLTLSVSAWYLLSTNKTSTMIYVQCLLLGFAAGYWAVFVTTSAEQFGTNLRATVATTVPNFVRGALVPALILFSFLRKDNIVEALAVFGDRPLANSAIIVGIATFALAFTGWWFLRETYGKELEYVET